MGRAILWKNNQEAMMKKYKWHLLVIIALAAIVLSAGSCFNITVPAKEGQQPAGDGQTAPPVINAFSATPANITAGSSTTLSWQVTGANTVTISPGIGSVAMSGSSAVSPGAATAYMLTATNSAGSVTAVAQVSVEAASPSPPGPVATLPVIDSFAASPDSILVGGTSTLSWSVSNVVSVTISPGIGAVSPTGSKAVSPATTTTYTLTATNGAGWRSKSITVTASTIQLKPITPFVVFAMFEDKTWVLEKYGPTSGPQSVLAGKEVSARFDKASGKVSGTAGCNSYSAAYQRNFNDISVSGMTSTMMLCMAPSGIMQQESAFKNALSGAESCKVANSKLEISCSLDRILVFHLK